MKIERLVFLVSQFSNMPDIPKQFKRYIPGYEILAGIKQYGIVGYAANEDVPEQQLHNMVRKGMQTGLEGTAEEYKVIVSKLVYNGVIEDNDITPRDKVSLLALLDAWGKDKNISLVDKEVTSFDKALPIKKDDEFIFTTGHSAFDTLVNGLPENSLTMILSKTGEGKSSFMLQLADELAGIGHKIVFASYEMSASAVRYRARHLDNLSGNCKLLSGSYTIDELEEYCDKDTILFVDYLALVPSKHQGELRHKLAHIASELHRLSMNCKAVVTAHQIKRNETNMSIDSISESFAAVWYCSLVVGLEKKGLDYENTGFNTVVLSSLKNRYGKANSSVTYPFNYATLEYKDVTTFGDSNVDYDASW